MDRIAIFVDSGYLYAQGSTALSGSKKLRTEMVLDPEKVVEALKRQANDSAPDCSLLRIYWYDGAIGGSRPTADQALLADLNDIKLRLGFVNSHGQQKGVDSLIVTDMIELARQHSICDALLLSGDEDVRVGVQIAQNYGVRLHLLGISPSRGSQSMQLLQEADTTVEWSSAEISEFLQIKKVSAPSSEPVLNAQSFPPSSAVLADTLKEIGRIVEIFVADLSAPEINGVSSFWKAERGVPKEMDSKLLGQARGKLGRNLDQTEMRHMRATFQTLVKERLQ